MKKKFIILIISFTVFSLAVGAALAATNRFSFNKFSFASNGNYWNHYARVEPTETRHGSREFWANCSTHDFVLEEPIGEIRSGVPFDTTTYFDELTNSDPRYIPANKDRVDIKGYFLSLLDVLDSDPYSYIPDTMRPDGVTKHSQASVTYDFNNFENVSEIQYGGFGEQWQMVVENIKESERFYCVTSYGSEIMTASRVLVSTFLDDYYGDTVTRTFNDSESRFTSKIDFDGTTLTYNIQFLSGITIPYFGTLTPQIDMEYIIADSTKSARIQLSENNALKFVVTPDSYTFGLEYGVDAVSRKAYFTISEDENDEIEGHIYEFVQLKGKDLVPSCADFYIDEDYTVAVGNKARGIIGLDNCISEVYTTNNGRLLGYEIQEEKSISAVSVTFNTLWFNLNNISGLNTIKMIEKESHGVSENPHNVYLNGQESVFATKNYGGLSLKTASRRYDIEERLQYFYGVEDEEIVEYETSIPMMFVQEEQLSSFSSDVSGKNSYLSVSINLSSTYLNKIKDCYDEYVPIFVTAREDDPIDSEYIETFIGDALDI